jgi:hypothetical protein
MIVKAINLSVNKDRLIELYQNKIYIYKNKYIIITSKLCIQSNIT